MDPEVGGQAAAAETRPPARGTLAYLPEPREARQGLALCLSGGGFRAALFHLGALRRLHELGILARVDTVSAVSGGSILAAHLAARLRPWPTGAGTAAEWEKEVARPFRAVTARGLRTGPLLRRYLLPWNWPRGRVAVEGLARAYERRLTGLTLPDLPERPRFVFCATDLAFGVNFVFERDRVGDWQAGYLRPAPPWPVARAVAASSCFPPLFAPMALPAIDRALTGGSFPPGPEREDLVRHLRLSDGGLYDNLGLEPVWKDHACVLVSDGGAPFRAVAARTVVRRLRRYVDVAGAQGAAIRKRWLIASLAAGVLDGTYWGVGSSTARYGPEAPPGYPAELVDDVVSAVRTDLDRFTPAESAVLENHGYLLAEAAIRRHAPSLSTARAPLDAPFPDWLDADRVRRALRHSRRRFAPRRWLARRD